MQPGTQEPTGSRTVEHVAATIPTGLGRRRAMTPVIAPKVIAPKDNAPGSPCLDDQGRSSRAVSAATVMRGGCRGGLGRQPPPSPRARLFDARSFNHVRAHHFPGVPDLHCPHQALRRIQDLLIVTRPSTGNLELGLRAFWVRAGAERGGRLIPERSTKRRESGPNFGPESPERAPQSAIVGLG